jgi:phage shock protein E
MKRSVFFAACFLLLISSTALAQFPVIDVEQMKSKLDGKQKVVVVDARTFEEYQQGHIPGAINIIPDNIKSSSANLPKDKKAPIVFYCRGME